MIVYNQLARMPRFRTYIAVEPGRIFPIEPLSSHSINTLPLCTPVSAPRLPGKRIVNLRWY